MCEKRITVGEGTEDGKNIEITRQINAKAEEYITSAVVYDCYGVETVDVDTPDTMGTTNCMIGVEFVNGKKEYFFGYITEIGE